MRARFNGLSSLQAVTPYLDHIEKERPNSDSLLRLIYLELKLRLPELLLMRVDKITMATSVEARVPFLDHHLVEYALGLPRALKVEGTEWETHSQAGARGHFAARSSLQPEARFWRAGPRMVSQWPGRMV